MVLLGNLPDRIRPGFPLDSVRLRYWNPAIPHVKFKATHLVVAVIVEMELKIESTLILHVIIFARIFWCILINDDSILTLQQPQTGLQNGMVITKCSLVVSSYLPCYLM